MSKAAIQAYLQTYTHFCPEMTAAELQFIETQITISEYKSKDFYLKTGNVQASLGFVYSGLMRAFCLDQKGNEITVGFVKENEYATHYSSYIRQTPSNYDFQCLEPCLVVNLPYTVMQEGYLKYKNIERYGRLVTEEVLYMQQKRIESFLFQQAEERYLDFIQANPNLFNRVSLSYLSSYLGIERQSLSRIRKKLATK